MAFTAISNFDAAQDVIGLIAELVAAVNERCGVDVGTWSTMVAPVGSDFLDIQNGKFDLDGGGTTFYMWAYELQNRIEAICDTFVNTSAVEAGGDFHGRTTAGIPMWTPDNLWAEVTGEPTATGPRRYTTHPDDGGSVSYGKVQVFDIYGAWIIEDLQAACELLIWTTGSGSSYTDTWGDAQFGEGYNEATWASAKTEAEGSWQTADAEGIHAYTTGIIDAFDQFDAFASASRSRITVSGMPSNITKDIDIYLWADVVNANYTNTFDNNGVPAITGADQLNKITTEIGHVGTSFQTGYIGDNSFPNWCGAPTGSEQGVSRGFVGKMNEIYSVIKLDRAGGFTHY